MRIAAVVSTLCVLSLTACGTSVPRIEEVWEPTELRQNMEYRIKEKVFCELVRALKHVRQSTIDGMPLIPDTYGVQMQLDLTIDELGGVGPSISFNDFLKSAIFEAAPFAQSLVVNTSANLQSTATRHDSSYTYLSVKKIAAPNANTYCDHEDELDTHGSSPLLRRDLGIYEYLRNAAESASVYHSSKQGGATFGEKAKPNIDVYSYEVKFVVISSGTVNPVLKVVALTTGSGSNPLITQSRTRTHDLTLTFGPGDKADPSRPSVLSQTLHQTNILNQSLQQRSTLSPP